MLQLRCTHVGLGTCELMTLHLCCLQTSAQALWAWTYDHVSVLHADNSSSLLDMDTSPRMCVTCIQQLRPFQSWVWRHDHMSLLHAGNSSSPTSKAATISTLINSAAPGAGQDTQQFLTSLGSNPAAWFNFTAAYVNIEPPGMLLSYSLCGQL